MNKYKQINKEIWNKRTEINMASEEYNLKGFKEGNLSLKSIEKEGIGNVEGKTLLHLQCGFGMDTLSLAKLGATVTGVDFSDKSIEAAKSLSKEMKIPARFIESELFKLPEVLDEKFDIVFTSYGVLCWMPNIINWAKVVSHFLKSGGIFYIVDIHPFSNVFEMDKPDISDLEVTNSYFHRDEPEFWAEEGLYEWRHSISDIINALANSGLRILSMKEYPFGCYQMFPFMIKDKKGFWRLKDKDNMVPLLFSLKARKE